MEKNKLALGSGEKYHGEEWIHLDIVSQDHATVVHDLEKGTLPFTDDSFEEVKARHVLEHLPEQKAVEILQEIARVSRPGAHIEIVLPHFLSWNSQDLDHHWSGSRRTFVQFCENYGMNSPYPEIFAEKEIKFVLEESLIYNLLDRFFSRKDIAQYVPNAVREICFELEVKA